MKGKRYLDGVPTEVAYAILRKLPFMSIEAALEFYETQARAPGFAKSNIERFLAANDRFYLLAFILRRRDALSEWVYDRCREVEAEPDGYLDLWFRYGYKAVDVNEPVPTPDGWRRHGDLKPGDRVFGLDGLPCLVVARTPVATAADCYRVTFDKGYAVTVSGDHEWTVDVRSKARVDGNKREGRRSVTLNTRELKAEVDRANSRSDHPAPSVRVAAALRYDPASLPIEPYALGCWLGDGHTDAGTITSGYQDAEELIGILTSFGHAVRRIDRQTSVALTLDGPPVDENGEPMECLRGHDRTAPGALYRHGCRICKANNQDHAKRGVPLLPVVYRSLHVQLSDAGLLGNKHIPEIYQTASIEQRVALLQGLMDTDGSCDRTGTATFVNKSESLAADIERLAIGLGLKPNRRLVNGSFEGRPYPYWHVSFQARAPFAVFRLVRKQVRAPKSKPIGSNRHRIVCVEPVASVPVSCIQVDRPDGLYLIGRHCIATHNSTVITFAGSFQEIINNPEITIGIFSNTSRIAVAFLEQIKRECEENEYLANLFPDIFWPEPRKDAPRWSSTGIIVNRQGNPKEATVEAHGVLDALPTSRHYDLLIFDDLVTENSVTDTDSDQAGKTTIRWELAQSLGHAHSRRWMVGTRYSYGDTYGTLIDRQAVKTRIYPATHDGTLNGRPVFFSASKWEEIKRDQRDTVSAQMLLNPIAGTENTFFVKYLRPFTLRPRALNVYIIGDPAGKPGSSKSDRTAIPVIGVDRAGNRYLLDGYCHKMRLSEKYEALANLYKKWKGAPGIEMVRVAWERYGMQTDIEYFEERIDRDKIDGFTIDEVSWVREGGQSKKARIGRLEPYFRNSQFYIPPKVLLPDHGVSLWSIHVDQEALMVNGQPVTDSKTGATIMVDVEGSARLAYRPYQPNKLEIAAKAAGEGYRIMEPIRRIDQDGVPYDVTRLFMEEFRLHPFAPHEDFLDAMSRIQDVDATPPMDSGTLKALESPLYVD